MLFSFQRQKVEKTCQAVLPLRARLHICQHFVYVATQQRGRGVFPFPAGNKSLEGKFCWYSALLLPFINEAINVLLSARSVSANAYERWSLACPPWGHRAAALRAEAPSGVSSPRTGSQGLTHCTVKPSQRLFIRRCSEPADNRGTCPLLRFWNESATPAHAEADA